MEKIWKDDLTEFIEWRNTVDSEVVLDQFDLALGWFSGRGYSNEDSIEAAKCIMDRTIRIEEKPCEYLKLSFALENKKDK